MAKWPLEEFVADEKATDGSGQFEKKNSVEAFAL